MRLRLAPTARRTGATRSVRPGATLAAAVVVALALSACGAAGTSASSAAACPVPEQELTQLAALESPKSWVGEASACLPNASVTPIAANVTSQLPVTVTDMQGTEVTITDTSRILTLDIYGTLSATVFALGLGGNVVGRDTSTGFPEAADLPLVTQNGHELNGEAVLELAPTVILTDTSIGPWDTILQLRESGIPVVILPSHRDLDNVGEIVTSVAAALGVPEEGALLASSIDSSIQTKQADIAALVPQDDSDKLRMMFLYVRGSAGIYYIFGEESGADDLISSLGGIDVASEIGWKGMRPMTAEALVQAQPDLILMMSKGLESVDGVDGLLERIPAVAETPAGQNRRIVDMSDYEILSFGPRVPLVLDALARAIYAPESTGATSMAQ